MITEVAPSHWRDLQQWVARVLKECGFSVEIEKKVKTARGTVEIDVYAEEVVNGRRYIAAVECKNWRARVPQAVIHGFRTVVTDIGANLGYIVSAAGFQSGAFMAAELTNLRLLDWQAFQSEFERSWYEAYLLPTVADQLDALLTYTEPLLPRWFHDLPDKNKEEYIELKRKYDEFGWTMMMFTPYSHLLHRGRDPRVELPLRSRLEGKCDNLDQWPKAVTDSLGYREFLDASISFGRDIVEQFRRYRPPNIAVDEVDLPRKA